MKQCCEEVKSGQSNALKIVFIINLVMFFIEFSAGLKAGSTALMGDSLDMLGDAFVYGFSLYVLYKTALLRIRAAQLKGFIMLTFGLGVLIQAAYKIHSTEIPVYQTMTLIGGLALLANLTCLGILYSHRHDDINLRSTWICSRNDIMANLGTIAAAFLVAAYQSIWPDIIVGVTIATLFLTSSYGVLKESSKQRKLINQL